MNFRNRYTGQTQYVDVADDVMPVSELAQLVVRAKGALFAMIFLQTENRDTVVSTA